MYINVSTVTFAQKKKCILANSVLFILILLNLTKNTDHRMPQLTNRKQAYIAAELIT